MDNFVWCFILFIPFYKSQRKHASVYIALWPMPGDVWYPVEYVLDCRVLEIHLMGFVGTYTQQYIGHWGMYIGILLNIVVFIGDFRLK